MPSEYKSDTQSDATEESYIIVPSVQSDELTTSSANRTSHFLESLITAFQALSTQERIELEQRFSGLTLKNDAIDSAQSSRSQINPVYVAIAEQMRKSQPSDCSSGNRVNSLYVAIATLMLKSEPDDLALFLNSISQNNRSRNNSNNSDIFDFDASKDEEQTQFSAETVISRTVETNVVDEHSETEEITDNIMEDILLMLARYAPDSSHIITLGMVALTLLTSIGIVLLVMMPVPGPITGNVPILTNIEPPLITPNQQPLPARARGFFIPAEHEALRAFAQQDRIQREVAIQQAGFDLRQHQQEMQRDIERINAMGMAWVRR